MSPYVHWPYIKARLKGQLYTLVKMKSSSLVFLLLLPLFVAISAKNLNRDEENLDESIEEFEKEFNQLFSDPEDEKAAAAELAKEEAEIKVYISVGSGGGGIHGHWGRTPPTHPLTSPP
jgi:hypothetical protein